MGKKQRTLRTLEELRDWIENTPHNETSLDETTKIPHVLVSNYNERIRVPQPLWKEAPLRPGGQFDNRMWRWGKEPPAILYVHPDVLTSTLVFPIQHHEMATKLKGYNGCTVALEELL